MQNPSDVVICLIMWINEADFDKDKIKRCNDNQEYSGFDVLKKAGWNILLRANILLGLIKSSCSSCLPNLYKIFSSQVFPLINSIK